MGGVPFVKSMTPLPFSIGERDEKLYMSVVVRLLGGVVAAVIEFVRGRLLIGEAGAPGA